jgi:DNA-binding response OmpR family regulator
MAAENLRPLILICDDELPLRELIKAALGDRYDYVEASMSQNPEAIVLDVMLPGKSGIDFLSELRSGAEDTTPVVVVSAWQSPADERAALGAGADAFIGKPFDPEDLAAVVEGLIAA